MSDVTKTLKERGERYGKFDGHANISQALKNAMQCTKGWVNLDAAQREALEMIVHKIARILNGDPNYADSWHDIAGYAKLVEAQLEGKGLETHQDADDWIVWGGGARPVEKGSCVDVKFRGGKCAETRVPEEFRWQHKGIQSDIIAYRFIEDSKAGEGDGWVVREEPKGPQQYDGWLNWSGGACPVRGRKVEVCFRNGRHECNEGKYFAWRHLYDDYDIVAYRIIEDSKVDEAGWIERGGGECPVSDLLVELKFRDGEILKNRRASNYRW